MFWYILLYIIFFIPSRLLYPTRVLNKQNMPKKRAILSCNHLSMIDPVYIAIYSRRKAHFFAKKELAKNRFLRFLVPAVGSVFVERGEADIAAVKKVLQILKKDKILMIFPEGTRNKTGEDIQELKTGAVTFAVKTDTPVIPVIVWRRPKAFRRNFIYYGKPISFAQYKDVKMSHAEKAEATAVLTEKMAEAKRELRDYLLKKRPRLLKRHEAKQAGENKNK